MDDIYITTSDECKLTTKKLNNCATDHFPILAELCLDENTPKRQNKTQHILKRSMKNFNKKIWIDSLRNQDFSNISNSLGVDSKTEEFTNKINSALDECAPFKKFKTRKNLKPGITDQAKKLILERDKSRLDLIKARKEDNNSNSTKEK